MRKHGLEEDWQFDWMVRAMARQSPRQRAQLMRGRRPPRDTRRYRRSLTPSARTPRRPSATSRVRACPPCGGCRARAAASIGARYAELARRYIINRTIKLSEMELLDRRVERRLLSDYSLGGGRVMRRTGLESPGPTRKTQTMKLEKVCGARLRSIER
jgi:hypothetical protein